MTRVSEIAEHWFGLCRKPPLVHASQADIVNLHKPAHESRPDGGAGGPGTIRRGIGAALSGMRTLNRNRQLLWFTLLAGLMLAGNTVGQAARYNIGWTMQPGIIVRLGLDFLIELATLFCLVFLLTGLALSISSKKEGSASFFVELAGAKKYIKAIFLWSFVLALASMLLFRIYFYFPVWLPREFWFNNIVGPIQSFPYQLLSQFPFNVTRDPNIFFEIPGELPLLPWIYPYGFMQALIFSVINLLLFIMTPFVVPLIVLEQKTLREAVAGSFAMMKKIWIEVAACAVFLGVVVFGVFLTYLLVQTAHGMVTPPEVAFIYRPTDMWIALGLLYDLVLFSVAFVVATVGGIAALDLYTSAKNRQIAGSPEPEPQS